MSLKLIKWAFYLLLLTFSFLFLYHNNNAVILDVYEYKIYTSTGILLFVLLAVWVVLLRIFILYNLVKFKIRLHLAKKEYDKKFESPHVQMENALEKGFSRSFVRLLYNNADLKSYKLYESFAKSLSPQKKLKIATRLYKKHPDNSVAGLMYAQELCLNQRYEEARKIVSDFVENRSIITQSPEVLYLLSKLGVEIESKSTGNLDFAQRYLDNIETYTKSHPKTHP
jgi:uncharacterized protein HemY